MNVQEELVSLARQIAKERGYAVLVDGLQPLEDYKDARGELQSGLKSKFVHELTEELRECVALQKERLWYYSEAADCLYYAACIDEIAPHEDAYTTALLTLASPAYQISQEEAEAAALAKYRVRAARPYRKDRATETEKRRHDAQEHGAIQAALESVQKWPGWPLTEVAEMYGIPASTLNHVTQQEMPPFPVRRAGGRITLIDIKHPRFLAWYAGYRRQKGER